MSNGDICIFPLITMGFKMLSTVPTIAIAQIKRPIAEAVLPVIKRKIIAGTETNAVPIIGISEATAATTPQRAAFGTPNNHSPVPINIP